MKSIRVFIEFKFIEMSANYSTKSHHLWLIMWLILYHCFITPICRLKWFYFHMVNKKISTLSTPLMAKILACGFSIELCSCDSWQINGKIFLWRFIIEVQLRHQIIYVKWRMSPRWYQKIMIMHYSGFFFAGCFLQVFLTNILGIPSPPAKKGGQKHRIWGKSAHTQSHAIMYHIHYSYKYDYELVTVHCRFWSRFLACFYNSIQMENRVQSWVTYHSQFTNFLIPSVCNY